VVAGAREEGEDFLSGEYPAGREGKEEREEGVRPSPVPGHPTVAWDRGVRRKGSEEEEAAVAEEAPLPPPPPAAVEEKNNDIRVLHSVSRMAVMRGSSIPAPRMTATRSEASATSSNAMPFTSSAAKK